MINIKSYLKDNDKLIPLAQYSGSIEDPDYVEGAIALEINGKTLISKSMWDYIDQLWAYIADGLLDVSLGNDFEGSFPDQPIEISFSCIDDNKVKISIECNELESSTIDKSLFLSSMINEGISFFEKLSQIIPKNSDSYNLVIKDLMSIKIKEMS